MVEFTVIIPARYASTRLPGKPLREIAGAPMIRHVHRRACESGASRVIVATDDRRIATACREFGAAAMVTSNAHETGTDRLAEVVRREALTDDAVIVNLQGDEPLMPPALLSQVADNLSANPDAAIATLSTPLESAAQILDPNVVKVATDRADYALYFSRAPIPWDRDGGFASATLDTACYRRHLGVYAYRAGFLRRYPELEACELERLERLEQLRALYHGHRIHVGVAPMLPGPGVDTEADIERVAAQLKGEAP